MSAQAKDVRFPTSSDPDVLARQLEQALRDVRDRLARMPEIDIKQFDLVAGNYPIRLRPLVKNVVSIIGCAAWNLDDPNTRATAGGVSWDRGSSSDEVVVWSIDGLTTGTRYRVRLEVKGTR